MENDVIQKTGCPDCGCEEYTEDTVTDGSGSYCSIDFTCTETYTEYAVKVCAHCGRKYDYLILHESTRTYIC